MLVRQNHNRVAPQKQIRFTYDCMLTSNLLLCDPYKLIWCWSFTPFTMHANTKLAQVPVVIFIQHISSSSVFGCINSKSVGIMSQEEQGWSCTLSCHNAPWWKKVSWQSYWTVMTYTSQSAMITEMHNLSWARALWRENMSDLMWPNNSIITSVSQRWIHLALCLLQ